MSVKLPCHRPLTNKDLLYLLEIDGPEFDEWVNEDATSDLEDEDILEELLIITKAQCM